MPILTPLPHHLSSQTPDRRDFAFSLLVSLIGTFLVLMYGRNAASLARASHRAVSKAVQASAATRPTSLVRAAAAITSAPKAAASARRPAVSSLDASLSSLVGSLSASPVTAARAFSTAEVQWRNPEAAEKYAEELVSQQSPDVLSMVVEDPEKSETSLEDDLELLTSKQLAEIEEAVAELEEVIILPRPAPLIRARDELLRTIEAHELSKRNTVDAGLRSVINTHVLLHLARLSATPNSKFRSPRIQQPAVELVIAEVLNERAVAGEIASAANPASVTGAIEAVIKRIEELIEQANKRADFVMERLAYDDETLRSVYTKERIAREYWSYVRDTGIEPEVTLFEKQLAFETHAVSAAVARYREMAEELSQMGRGATLKPAQQFVVSWFEPLAQAIEFEQKRLEHRMPAGARRQYAQCLLSLDASELACVVMHELLNKLLISPGGVRFIEIALAVGRSVNAEMNLNRIRANKLAHKDFMKAHPSPNVTDVLVNSRRYLQEEQLPEVVRAQVGASLLQIMINTVTTRMSPSLDKMHPRYARTVSETAPIITRHMREKPHVQPPPKDITEEDFAEEPVESVPPAGTPSPDAELIEDKSSPLHKRTEEAISKIITDGQTRMEPLPLAERAFYHEYVPVRHNKLVGVIRCHKDILALIEEGHAFVAGLSPKLMPMVIPPRPWRGPRQGGYVSVATTAIRAKGSRKQIESIFHAEMPDIYSSLDVLGRVPWRVNRKIFDVVKQVWENGGAATDLPARVDIPPLPVPVAPLDLTEDELKDEVTVAAHAEAVRMHTAAMRRYTMQNRKLEQANADLHSLRCDVSLKLNQAEQLMDRNIYFPCNVDFRGRAYPIPPHLNHLGSDMSRGILCFAEARPLGKRGLYWLYAHLAAQFGVDKISFDDRVAYAKSLLDRILEAADDPLRPVVPNPRYGKTLGPLDPPVMEPELIPWWQTADAPWQALATCFEIANAVRCENPEEYLCALPVHQDGSCNGLQHYAALGRDELGGARVNLLPADKPQDVYSHVLARVKELMEEDMENGSQLAAALLPYITRKVVKQTVMTSVYGVTFVGAREQVMRQLVDLRDVDWPEPKEKSIYQASMYVARLTLNSLSTVFTGAKSIMTWLGDCASLIAKEQQPVSWITPLGLPVTQPYRKASAHTVRTLMQSITFTEHNDALPVSSTRQKAAFPPNFVHSLDATHMMTTSIECEKRGLCFSSVHDSFWTHACDVDTMNEVLRDQFIELYSQPILEDLYTTFCIRFPHINFPPVPQYGSLDLNRIRESKYFFS